MSVAMDCNPWAQGTGPAAPLRPVMRQSPARERQSADPPCDGVERAVVVLSGVCSWPASAPPGSEGSHGGGLSLPRGRTAADGPCDAGEWGVVVRSGVCSWPASAPPGSEESHDGAISLPRDRTQAREVSQPTTPARAACNRLFSTTSGLGRCGGGPL